MELVEAGGGWWLVIDHLMVYGVIPVVSWEPWTMIFHPFAAPWHSGNLFAITQAKTLLCMILRRLGHSSWISWGKWLGRWHQLEYTPISRPIFLEDQHLGITRL
jgi:hypothetical protein